MIEHAGRDTRRTRRLWKPLAGWVVLVSIGMFATVHYATTPANIRPASENWPTGTSIVLDRERPTLVTFFHPQCPCSRAGITELSALVSRCQDAAAIRIVFVRPAGLPAGWERSELWQMAMAIPGGELIADAEGQEADRFQTTTSGETLLFAPDGHLLFQGGVNWARGHEGESVGRNSLQSLILAGKADCSTSPVYGCGLNN